MIRLQPDLNVSAIQKIQYCMHHELKLNVNWKDYKKIIVFERKNVPNLISSEYKFGGMLSGRKTVCKYLKTI